MLQIIPITQARQDFLRLIDEVSSGASRYLITKQGRPVAVILGYEEYSRMAETLKMMGDDLLRRQLKKGMAELMRGEMVPFEVDGG